MHTPTPWVNQTAVIPHSSTDGRHYLWNDPDNENDSRCVAIVPDAADAAFIIKACNSHDKLVAALCFYVAICGNTAAVVDRKSAGEAYDLARAALVDY
jgi:hypothetical protein